MRKVLLTAVVAVGASLLLAPSAGGFPTGYTLNFTSAEIGDTDVLTATLVGDVCDDDLRIALYRPDTSMVTDNGNGAVMGATQINLTNPGSLVTEPGTYSIGVTCGGQEVGSRTPFEVLAAQVPPPPPPPPTEPPTVPPTDVGPVAAEPGFTG
jgi:hypothetical protein